jgi:hypothetical protein
MITTRYPPETGWIAVRHAELITAAKQHRQGRAGRHPRTLDRRRTQVLEWRRAWKPNVNRMEQAR